MCEKIFGIWATQAIELPPNRDSSSSCPLVCITIQCNLIQKCRNVVIKITVEKMSHDIG